MRMRHMGTSASLLVMVFMVSACSAGADTDQGEAGSCGLWVRFDGRVYAGTGVKVLPTYGAPLGTAVAEPCEPFDPGGWGIDAVELVGVDPAVAFGSLKWGRSIFIAMDETGPLPAEVKRLLREPPCEGADEPIELSGPWLGIMGPDETTELDLLPPYDLSMQVEQASVPTYERSFLTIHVGPELGQPLTRDDVDAFLLQEGDLSVTAHCVDDQFWADRVDAGPPA